MTSGTTDVAGAPRVPVPAHVDAPARGSAPDLAWLDWLRVLAIVGVVTIHVVGSTALAPWARTSRLGWLAIWLDIGFVFVVPVFVMISGALFLDPARFRGTGDFLRRRALRLLPALVVWHLVYWAFRVVYLDQEIGVRDFLESTVTGRLYPHLYYFWVVLGLVVVTPVLVPWVATAPRRSLLLAGLCAASMPVLTVALRNGLEAAPVWVETPWTWWLFYLGLYLLGSALRDVVLRGVALVAAGTAAVLLGALLTWQWRNPAAPGWLQVVSPVSYYGLGVHVYAVLVLLVARALVRPGGVGRVLARPAPARVGRVLGAATLGVFCSHLLLVPVVAGIPALGGDAAAGSSVQLVARVACVLVISYTATLVLRRVPVVRSVL
ncbi:acyltransferase family protein [Cellulosimicrobium sp. ES-005]|uniref:Acyltransferase family protein n=1 Tax=Cellulosimicrobium sp. ES-005 TaxID=3163031 RepID=A0AAU8G1U3_9MICO